MAIDRAPWNALIDDDGSNLVGSSGIRTKSKPSYSTPLTRRSSTPAA